MFFLLIVIRRLAFSIRNLNLSNSLSFLVLDLRVKNCHRVMIVLNRGTVKTGAISTRYRVETSLKGIMILAIVLVLQLSAGNTLGNAL
jgi:hypothetical protein